MIKIDFNANWRVSPFDEPNNFQMVDVPYDCMFLDGQTERQDDAPTGKNCSWIVPKDYEFTKEFEVSEEYKNKDIIIEFEGIYRNAKVYLNDEEVAFRPYGYTNFYINLTDKIKFNEKNIIKVKAYNADQPNSRWYSGTGIIRPVWLYFLNKERIELNSLKIRTIDYKTRTVEVSLKTTAPTLVKIEFIKNNEVLKTFSYKVTDYLKENISLDNFELWNVDTPNLYILKATLVNGYSDEIKFGIREISYSPEGFKINGQRCILYGGCIHSDLQILGGITNKFAEYRRVRILKKAGYNALRSAHNPMCKWLLEACDELGMLVLDEYVDMWYLKKNKYDYCDYIKDYWKQDLYDMIQKDYSHPCVVMYSIGNEVGETAQKKGIEITKTFVEYIHSLDETRPVTCGINIAFNFMVSKGIGFYSEDRIKKENKNNTKKKKKKKVGSEFFNELATLLSAGCLAQVAKLRGCDKATRGAFANMDIAGYNYGILRYKKDLKKYPNRLILGTETFCKDARLFYNLAKENERIIGDFVWAAQDYLGEDEIGSMVPADHCKNNFNGYNGWVSAGSGRVDLIGNELAEALYTKVAFEKEQIKIAAIPPRYVKMKHSPSSWKLSMALPSWSFDGDENKKSVVEVYSRGYKVSLFLNDKLLKTKKVKKTSLNKFKIKYKHGKLEARVFDKNGKLLGITSLTSANKETLLKIYSENETITSDGLAFVHARFTDNEGRIKVLKEDRIKFEVEGGKILSCGSSNPYNDEWFLNDNCLTNYGECLVVVKPKKDSKEIKVKAISSEYEKEIIIPIKN